MDLQDPHKKMSKSVASSDGTIWLTDTPDAIQKKIRSAVTDSGSEVKASDKKPAITNLLTIYSVISNQSVEETEHEFAGTGYARFKNAVADALSSFGVEPRDLPLTPSAVWQLVQNARKAAE